MRAFITNVPRRLTSQRTIVRPEICRLRRWRALSCDERTLQEEIRQAEQNLEESEDAKFKPEMPGGYLEDFSRVFEQIPLEKKRRLKYALFSGKVSYIKRGEETGEIELKLRGDGFLKRTWEDVKKENQVRQVRTPVPLLRERLKDSNSVILKIPIETHNLRHGQRLTCMDGERLPHELGLDEEAIQGFLQAGLIRCRPQKPPPEERIDYAALQQTYRRMLAEAPFSTQTELARHMGVSRVRVSRVLKGIMRKVG